MAKDVNGIKYVPLPMDVKRELCLLIRNGYRKINEFEEAKDVKAMADKVSYLRGAERVLAILGYRVGRSRIDAKIVRRKMGCMLDVEKEDKE